MKFKKTIELQYADLKAAALCKAKSDVRFYLCGVYIGDGFIAATNGHVGLIIDEELAKGMDLIIPAETVDSLVKKVGNNPLFKTVNLHQIDDEFWLLENNSSYELFKPVDGKFPNIKKIDIEKPVDINFKQYPNFDFAYLGLFLRVGKVLGRGLSPQIYPTTESGCAYVELTEKAHGLLMPMRI